MARTVYKSRLKSIRAVTASLRELVVEWTEPKTLTFAAGQFVMLHVPQDGEKPALRAYSIASAVSDVGQITLLIKLLEDGISSNFLRTLKGGEELSFTGPFGKLLFREPPTEQVLLLSTGAGLSQHMSFLKSHAGKFPKTKFHALIGVWNESEVFYQKELDEIKKTLPCFDYQFVLDKAGTGWAGLKGYITQHIDPFQWRTKPTTFYLCGNPAMIKSAKQLLIEENGFPADLVLAEAFS